MKTFRKIVALLLAVLCLFVCVACKKGEDPAKSEDQESHKTREITLAASSLQLPEGSGFSISFSDKNDSFSGVKTALPASGNQYINDLFATKLREYINDNKPAGASLAAVDTEICYRSEDKYSFGFALYFDLSEGDAREVQRLFLSADLAGGALLKLSDFLKASYFENSTVDEYVRTYLSSEFSGQYDPAKADALHYTGEEYSGFYVSGAGAKLQLQENVGASSALSVYLSNAALALYKRSGEVSTEEPENNTPDNYQPAKSGEKVVAMTFDDGPGSSSTSRLLDYLQSNGYKATFFVNGYNYSNLETDENAKALVRRAASIGCEIGNHTYAHAYFNKLTPEQRSYEINHNADLIYAACGVMPTLMRAPGGIFIEGMPEESEYFYISWSVDGGPNYEDWRRKSDSDGGQAVADAYLSNIYPGCIVLMHDIYNNSVDAAIKIMNSLASQGYRFVTVSELLDLENKEPDGSIYTSQNSTLN